MAFSNVIFTHCISESKDLISILLQTKVFIYNNNNLNSYKFLKAKLVTLVILFMLFFLTDYKRCARLLTRLAVSPMCMEG